MSTTIYEKQLPEREGSGSSAYLVISRHGVSNEHSKNHNNGHKCAYHVRIGTDTVFLTSDQMRDLVSDLNVFFYSEGYP
jgi:hypothetical protein